MSEQHGDRVRFVKLNVDENPQTAGRYNVLSIPTVILFANGEPAGDRRRREVEEPLRGRLGTLASVGGLSSPSSERVPAGNADRPPLEPQLHPGAFLAPPDDREA